MSKAVYTTRIPISEKQDATDFNWDRYFSENNVESKTSIQDQQEIFKFIKSTLKEDSFGITFVLTKMMRSLMYGITLPQDPDILELGAATGFLTRWLIEEYGGAGTLIDNNNSSIEAFKRLDKDCSYNINYIKADIFKLQVQKNYDVVCSFGLVEHFQNKDEILNKHIEFLKPNGYVIILVPLNTPLSRVYWEINPELNLGYRELLSIQQFKDIFNNKSGINIIKAETSFGYVYDFIAGIAQVKVP